MRPSPALPEGTGKMKSPAGAILLQRGLSKMVVAWVGVWVDKVEDINKNHIVRDTITAEGRTC